MQMRRYLVTSTRWGSGAPIAYTVSYISLAHTFNVVSTLECAKKHCESERIKETTIDILENSTLTRHTFSAVLFTMQWIVPHVWCQNNDDVMHASSLIWTNTVRHQTRIHFTVVVVHSSIFGLKSIFFWFLSLSLFLSIAHILFWFITNITDKSVTILVATQIVMLYCDGRQNCKTNECMAGVAFRRSRLNAHTPCYFKHKYAQESTVYGQS